MKLDDLIDIVSNLINRNMRCIEIFIFQPDKSVSFLINRNMRCIEMYIIPVGIVSAFMINRNMRCIEISFCCFRSSLP